MAAARPDRRQLTRTPARAIEPLEGRQLLSAAVSAAFTPVLATPANPSADTINLLTHISDSNILGTVVKFDTPQGSFDVTLTDAATPATVKNFLSYVTKRAYNGTFFHRAVVLSTNAGGTPTNPSDIVQGGGYKVVGTNVKHIKTDPPVADEFTTELFGNVAGAIAMAKTSSANSATSEFYFNEHDTSSLLDTPTTDSTGALTSFTVFGKVLGDGMTVIDKLAALPTVDASKGNSALATLPVVGIAESSVTKARVHPRNLAYVNKVSVVSTTSGITYTVSSDNPTLVQPRLDGTSLAFSYASGQAGSAGITVTGTSIDGTSATQTFTVTVPSTTATGPVAADDTATAVSGQSSPVHVLTNDTGNAALAPSSLAIVTQPSHGTAQVDESTGLVGYTAAAGYTGPDTFQYTISDTAGVVSGPATVSLNVVNAPVTATVGASGANVLRYTQPDGTIATLRISNGSGAVTFAGPNVTVTTVGGVVTATGADATISSLVITNSANRDASLSVATNGSTHVATIGSITDTGNIKSLTGSSLSLTGNVAVGGLGRLQVGATSEAVLSIGSGLAGTSLDLGTAANTSVVSSVAIRRLGANSFADSNGLVSAITAPSIGTLAVRGDLSDAVNLTAAGTNLTNASIGGALGGSWALAGALGTLSAKSAARGWGVTAAGNIASVRLGGDLTGTISAANLGTVTVGGSITGGAVTGTGPINNKLSQIKRLSVGGSITNSAVTTLGNIGTITAGSLTGSQIYAGTSVAITSVKGLPTTTANFDEAATIAAVNLHAGSAAFSNSVIAAEFLRTIDLGTVVAGNGGTAEGVGASTITHLSAALDSGGRINAGKAQLKSASTFSAYVTTQKLTLNDFAVKIVTA